MKKPNSTARFFGLDLRQLQSDWTIALKQMAQWPLLRWLVPGYVTRIMMPTGKTIDHMEKAGLSFPRPHQAKTASYAGFLLPDELVLWHAMTLPKLSPDAAHSAMELEVKSLSPFLSPDLAWSHTALIPDQRGSSAHIVIASRKLIYAYVARQAPTEFTLEDFEIYVKQPQGHGLLVIDGFGEARRRRLATRWRIGNLCLVMLLATIGLAAAVTPTAQLRLRAMQAAQDYEKLRIAATPAIEQRELLVQLDQRLSALHELLEPSLRPELILLRITKLLPDDTFITQMQAQGKKIMLNGQTPNTAALMQQLGAQTDIKDVRAPSGAVKLRGSDRETFNIEFTLDSPTLQVVQ